MHLWCLFRPERSWDLLRSCWNGQPSSTAGPCRRQTQVFTSTPTKTERRPLSEQVQDVTFSFRTRLRRRRSCKTDRNVCRKTWRMVAARVVVEPTETNRRRPAEDLPISTVRKGGSSSVDGGARGTGTGMGLVGCSRLERWKRSPSRCMHTCFSGKQNFQSYTKFSLQNSFAVPHGLLLCKLFLLKVLA